MAPRTRRSRTITEANHTVGPSDENSCPIQTSTRSKTRSQRNIASHNINDTGRNINLPESKKRTISIRDDPTSGEAEESTPNVPNTPSATAPPTKRARNAGPIRSKPMQLILMSDDPVVNQQDELQDERDDCDQAVTKGKGKGKRPEIRPMLSSSRAPTLRAPTLQTGLAVDTSDNSSSGTCSDDGDTETEGDWIDEQHLTELAEKQPSKFEEAMRVERTSWKGSGATPDHSAADGYTGTQIHQDQADTLSEHHGGAVPDTGLMLETSEPSWPAITNLCIVPGTNRVTLSVQVPLMRVIIQDAFEHVRASLLFKDAYPDPIVTIAVVKEALISAAESHRPSASSIHNRLVHDNPYLFKISRLPRARIPLFRREVKERCVALVASNFAAIESAQIVQIVERQLTVYNYTYPSAPNKLGLPMRSRPYRNDRIIKVIRDLYFTGGSASFAGRFHHLFPLFRDSDAVWKHEVPIAMVALVGTALYAALREWRAGEHKIVEFSTTSYLDVYDGHVNSLKLIRDECNAAFHTMMADIYAQASSDQPNMRAMTRGSVLAPIDLTGLDD